MPRKIDEIFFGGSQVAMHLFLPLHHIGEGHQQD